MCHSKWRNVAQQERSKSHNVGVEFVPCQTSGIKMTDVARVILSLRKCRDNAGIHGSKCSVERHAVEWGRPKMTIWHMHIAC